MSSRGGVLFTYLREALTARFILKGIPEPQFVERVEDTDSHAFLFYIKRRRGEARGTLFKCHHETIQLSNVGLAVKRCTFIEPYKRG